MRLDKTPKAKKVKEELVKPIFPKINLCSPPRKPDCVEFVEKNTTIWETRRYHTQRVKILDCLKKLPEGIDFENVFIHSNERYVQVICCERSLNPQYNSIMSKYAVDMLKYKADQDANKKTLDDHYKAEAAYMKQERNKEKKRQKILSDKKDAARAIKVKKKDGSVNPTKPAKKKRVVLPKLDQQ